MNEGKVVAGIIGCGNIANRYAERMRTYPELELAGFADLDPARATQFAAEFGGKAYGGVDEILADPSIDLIVNLTIHHAHPQVIRKCLEAGKHVHTEKPLAMTVAEARELVELAKAKGLRLSSAPITYMGEAQQTFWKLLREGRAGQARLAYAEVNHGRIETWHPNPGPFYEVGILWDVAVYPLTLLTTIFGPVREVSAYGRVIYPNRVTKEGAAFTITNPDFVLAAIEFECGLLARLTANFYASGSKGGGTLEVIGDKGMVCLGNFQQFGASVEAADYAQPYEKVPLVREREDPRPEFARGVQDLAQAMLEDRPQRATGEHAAHVVEIVAALVESMQTQKRVAVTSQFPAPAPMEWSEAAPMATA